MTFTILTAFLYVHAFLGYLICQFNNCLEMFAFSANSLWVMFLFLIYALIMPMTLYCFHGFVKGCFTNSFILTNFGIMDYL